jgi:arylsulfatase A-like enzyme
MASSETASTGPRYSARDLLLIALWWGVLTGLAEGYRTPTYIWRDLTRAGVEIEPLLFLGVALLILALKRSLNLMRSEVARATALFSGLALFAAISRHVNPPELIGVLVSVAAASLLALLWFVGGRSLVRWQKRTLPVLLLLALWCVVAFPIKQRIHETRALAKLPAAAPGAPNVLVILVDTLRADHLSTYGYSRPTSPHLTRLAAQGTLFENAIAPSSWTLPVHASLLTGLYPNAHHVENDGSLLGWDYPVLGDAFMARGYRTAAFSANTLLFCRRRGFGRGFIHFEDDFQSLGSSFAQTFYGDLIKHLLFHLKLKRDLFGRRSAEDINRHALRWIEGGQPPFFIFLNYMDVHDPYRPPEPYLHRYTKMKDPGSRASEHWDWFDHLTPQQRQGALDAYDGAINSVDDHLQRFMDELRQRGLDRNTLVVITSDHGESFGEHGLMTHGSALYRELIHVPLILWAPGRIPAGKKIDAPVSLTSLPATLLEEAGEQQHPHFPQPSLAGLWSDQASQPSLPAPRSEVAQLGWSPSFPDYYGAMASVTTAHWHYIRGGKFHEELYPCCQNEPEQLNLAGTVIGRELIPGFERELAANSADPPKESTASKPGGVTYPLDYEPRQAALGDVNADGNLDIVVRGGQGKQVTLLLGDGKGAFRISRDHRAVAAFLQRPEAAVKVINSGQCRDTVPERPCAEALVRGDIDGNGLEDLAFADTVQDQIVFLLATGKDVFTKATLPFAQHPTSIGLADLNHDGKADLVILGSNSVTVVPSL